MDPEELEAMVGAVRDFAQGEFAPNAVQWDQDKHIPVDALSRAGDLGRGGIYTPEDVGGSGLNRAAAVRIFE